MNNRVMGYLLTAFSAFVFGIMPILSKFAFDGGCNPIMLVIIRGLFPVPILVAILIYLKQSFKITKTQLLHIFIATICGWSLTMSLLYSSYKYIPVGTATGIHFIYPILIMIGELLFFNKKFHYKMFLSMLFCLGGVILLINSGKDLDTFGVILALLSAFGYAAYIIIVDIYLKEVHPVIVTLYCGLINLIIMVFYAYFTNELKLKMSLSGYGYAILTGILCVVFGTCLVQIGIKIIGGTRAAVISTLEPITGIALSALFLNESIGYIKILGCVFIVISVIFCISSDSQRKS